MTREQAIIIYDRTTNIHEMVDTPRMIDRFVALGMLKLDEPKGADERFLDQVEGFGDLTRRDAATILSNLQTNGLRIVEK